MRTIVPWWRGGILFVVALFARADGPPAQYARSAASAQSASCAAPEYRQFDFWVGDWDAFEIDGPEKVARTRVELILDGCVLREDYQGADGHEGQSFTIYDASRNVWHQSWTTNRGQLLVIEGKMEGGEMVLSGVDHPPGDGERHVRGSWKAVTGGVRETAVISTDGGKTWKPWFDLMFRPHTGNASTSTTKDAKEVAALDTQYQAAVKANDARTMDRILADDFVLATGSGKTYTKADLLTDARRGQEVFEHNEELEQKVHVWGDTAIVTAKLWEKGTANGEPFDHTLWFSDTYVRTPSDWRYVFGQSSLPLPKTP
jgi:ketosteroid isomerase-like protein